MMRDANDWHLDKDYKACTYTNDNGEIWLTETVGCGIAAGMGDNGSGFANNSDGWIAWTIGWCPRGRFETNGSNLVLINHLKKQAFNVTRVPKAGSGDAKYCLTGGPRYMARHVDFWVQAPLDDIWEPLRNDVKPDVRNAYRVKGLDDGVSIGRITSKTCTHTPNISIVNGILKLNGPHTCTVSLLNAAGRTVVHTDAAGSLRLNTRLRPGVYLINIRNTVTGHIQKTIVTATGGSQL
jgi:hypothetical protein